MPKEHLRILRALEREEYADPVPSDDEAVFADLLTASLVHCAHGPTAKIGGSSIHVGYAAPRITLAGREYLEARSLSATTMGVLRHPAFVNLVSLLIGYMLGKLP